MNVTCEFCSQPNEAELAHIRRIYEENFPLSERKPFESFGLGSDGSPYQCLLARNEASPHAILALALLLPLPEISLFFLEYLAVDKRYQGQGAGELLLRFANTYAGAGAFEGLVWEVETPEPTEPNHSANRRIRFYEKQGARLIECSQGYAMPDYNPQCSSVANSGVPLRLMQLPLEAQPDDHQTCTIVRAIYKAAYPTARPLCDHILRRIQKPA